MRKMPLVRGFGGRLQGALWVSAEAEKEGGGRWRKSVALGGLGVLWVLMDGCLASSLTCWARPEAGGVRVWFVGRGRARQARLASA